MTSCRANRAALHLSVRGRTFLGSTLTFDDHGWGPRVVVFIDDQLDLAGGRRRTLAKTIDARLPDAFLGYSTRFAAVTGGPVTHQVSLTTISAWFMATLGFDPRVEIDSAAWLAAPSQLLRESTAGAVFEDRSGELGRAREQLRWYPDDVWLYLLGCQWRRIDQEEPFVGRAGEVADELGSAVVAARLARDLMRLCFLIERQYAPYSKWLGTAFAQLECAQAVTPLLTEALRARSWNRQKQR